MVAVVARDFTKPDGYALATIPRPTVMKDDDVVIKIHAASVNPVDVKKANGVFKAVLSEQFVSNRTKPVIDKSLTLGYSFPYKLGYDAAGVVDSVGPGVKNLKVGDEVYTRLPEIDRGTLHFSSIWRHFAK
jgi:NADPH:quinone reductase-like Zn-dependent oxidoreductase